MSRFAGSGAGRCSGGLAETLWVCNLSARGFKPLSELVDEMVADSEKSELHAIRDAELIENVSDVVLDGLHAQREPLSNFSIAVPGHNGRDDFHLARSEAEILARALQTRARQKAVENLNDFGNLFPAYPVLPFHDRADTLNDQFRRGLFEDNPARPELQGLGYFALFDGCGKDDGSRRRTRGGKVPKNIEARALPQSQVQQDNIRSQLVNEPGHFKAVRSLTDHLHAGFGLDQLSKTKTKRRVIINEQDTNRAV